MEREPRYFEYGEAEVAYLAARDPRLGEAMAVIGRIEREVHPDLFAALVNCIVGQQIATKAQTTIWNRMLERFGEVTPEAMAACSDDELQQVGISFRKVGYIKGAAARVLSGEVDLEGLAELSDDEVCRTLSALPGIGVWTAEMLMTFSMQRPNILSWGDLAIHRGLRMVHHHRRITPELFAKYRRRYTPYGSGGQPLSMGGGRRRHTRHEGLGSEKREEVGRGAERGARVSPYVSRETSVRPSFAFRSRCQQ